jgi:hypothetical protein
VVGRVVDDQDHLLVAFAPTQKRPEKHLKRISVERCRKQRMHLAVV